ncbi:MAG TPA: branched-chain amino acid ABC transporter permease [Acidimicrobiales bacterium]|nr:branched-chain amino acid ABC transporter permease [Acidimicrobiales bacterium]
MRKAVAVLLGASVMATLALASRAPQASAQPREPARAGQANGETVRGTLRYETESGEDAFAEGVDITVETADGQEVESVTSDADGKWEVALPGPGSYTVTIDPDTLPDGVTLQDEDRTTLTFEMSPGRSRAVLFALTAGFGGREVASGFERFVRLSVQGIRFGLVLGMAAIGLSLIFGTTGLVNFAHGELVTYGAILAFIFNVTIGWPMLVAAPIAIALATLTGSLVDRGFWRPLRNRGTGLIAMMVISIGLGLLVRYIFLFQFTGFPRGYREFTEQTSWELGPLRIVPRDAWTIVISLVVLIGVALFIQKNRMGKAMRAVSDNRDLAESSGIDVDRVINFVWAAGAGLAALGGILHGLSQEVTWQMGFQLLLLMFAGVVLGGLGSAYGALVGSLVVGVAVEVSTLWIPSEFKTVVALSILVLILLVRPQGILGQAERVG